MVNSCPVQSARASDRDGTHTASFPEDNARRPQNSMKPGRTVLAQILDYLWVVIANDNVHTEFRHAPGDRLLLQLGMWLKRPLSVRAKPSIGAVLSVPRWKWAVITESECPG